MNRLLWATLLTAVACQQSPTLNFKEVDSPMGDGTMFPSLMTTAQGEMWLSYLHEPDTTSSLLLSQWKEEQWQQPEVVSRTVDNDWFVNWADFPSVYQNEDQLLTYMLTKSGSAAYAYDISIFHRKTSEIEWKGPLIPHRDTTQTEHGFVSFFPFTDSLTGMVWLDGRNYAEMQIKAEDGLIEPEMMLRFTTIDRQAQLGPDQVLDTRVCSCCQTDAAAIPGGVVVMYRDRSEAEVRDISYLRYQDGQWSEPMALHNDGWTISGCPVNGPAIDAQNEFVAASWYTEADSMPKVLVAFSEDAAQTFSEPVRIDNGQPDGRLDLKLIDAKTAMVCWLEEEGEMAELMVAMVSVNGKIAEQNITKYPSTRGSGFPRLAIVDGREAWITWTVPGEANQVRLARTSLQK